MVAIKEFSEFFESGMRMIWKILNTRKIILKFIDDTYKSFFDAKVEEPVKEELADNNNEGAGEKEEKSEDKDKSRYPYLKGLMDDAHRFVEPKYKSAMRSLFPTKSSFYYFCFNSSTVLASSLRVPLFLRIMLNPVLGDAQVSPACHDNACAKDGKQEDICASVKKFQESSLGNHVILWNVNALICYYACSAVHDITNILLSAKIGNGVHSSVLSGVASLYLVSRIMDCKSSVDQNTLGITWHKGSSIMCSIEKSFVDFVNKLSFSSDDSMPKAAAR